jgi:2-polyprenyl-3-methyl-5-hydroxy-6-metoxy-1,4-benzoquinol methylase
MKQYWNQYWNDLADLTKSHWESGQPDKNLQAWFNSNPKPKKVLEIGCGTGTDSIWMAQQGCDVTAVDVSQKILDEAYKRSMLAGVNINFMNLDLTESTIDGYFDLVYDRGCFHLYNYETDRIKFVTAVAQLLKPNGIWLSLNASVECWNDGQPGKSAKSLTQLVNTIEPILCLCSIKKIWLDTAQVDPRAGWEIQSQLRDKPVAPWSSWLVDQ